jgi:hypothetical protein
MSEAESTAVFSFDQFTQHKQKGKFYNVIRPNFKREYHELSMYVSTPIHMAIFLEDVVDEPDHMVVITARPIGRTKEGDQVLIVMRADGQVARMGLGRWFVAICNPAGGKAELEHDIREDIENMDDDHTDMHELYWGRKEKNHR